MVRDAIRDIDDLEDRLSTPTEGALETVARLEGDIIFLGVAGKMGPTRLCSDTNPNLPGWPDAPPTPSAPGVA